VWDGVTWGDRGVSDAVVVTFEAEEMNDKDACSSDGVVKRERELGRGRGVSCNWPRVRTQRYVTGTTQHRRVPRATSEKRTNSATHPCTKYP
jgi:hypothetical protein